MKNFDIPNDTHKKIEKHFWEIFESIPNSVMIPKEIIKIKYHQLTDTDETNPNEYGVDITVGNGISFMGIKTLLDEIDGYINRFEECMFKEIEYKLSFLLLIGIKDKK